LVSSALGYPQILIAGFDGIGEPVSYPQERAVNTSQISEQVAFHPQLHGGRHLISAGADIRRVQLNGYVDFFARGRWVFLGLQGNSLEQLLRGTPDFALAPQGTNDLGLRTAELGFFVQDNFRLAPRLTLNLGLRWEYNQPPVEIQNRLSVPDFSPASNTCSPRPGCQFLVAGSSGIPNGLYRSYFRAFAPRLGVVWQATERLVMRSAYGVFNDVTVFQTSTFARLNPALFELGIFPNWGTNTIQDILQQTSFQAPPVARSIDERFRDAHIQQWNFGLQCLLMQDLALEAAYVGSRGSQLGVCVHWRLPLRPNVT
jgi:TonB dependent receptor-like, beta-barrel